MKRSVQVCGEKETDQHVLNLAMMQLYMRYRRMEGKGKRTANGFNPKKPFHCYSFLLLNILRGVPYASAYCMKRAECGM